MDPNEHEHEPAEWTRRAAMGAMAAGALAASGPRAGAWPAPATESKTRPRIAVIATCYWKTSHGQGITDRFIEGYGWQGRHHRPALDVVSLYIDQRPKTDVADDRLARHPGLKLYPTIAEALTRGGPALDVDGVVIIGEHGEYLRDDRGRTHYPRYEFFQQVVDVFRRSGRSVPVFNDKHLSWNWAWAKEMVATARELKFPFLAGSSLPVTWRIPEFETPTDAVLEEAVCVGYGGVDSYDFHGLESLQCFAERRRGGETGVKAVEILRGPDVWKALDPAAGGSARTRALFDACLCRSFRLTSPSPGYGNAFPTLEQAAAVVPDPIIYRLHYNDGLVGSLFMMSGLVADFTVAMKVEGDPAIRSTQLYLCGISPNQTLPNFFSPLANHIEAMFLTGAAPYPVERTLLTSGVVCTAVDLMAEKRRRAETPDLAAIAYRAPRESQYMRS
ncbi:hypothetical protein [Paludisphaera mucosa]|uniref:Uncharacterized protein n=1 Tax=Paludisphaera mucosa TaxID=3030827 RepID=A0ABT6FDQ7_9BACT|nr:hypothetical protein [Paludisphaera mucosa]MDG3005684.1 hypothetical protein [Paludisphaera mucosa]